MSETSSSVLHVLMYIFKNHMNDSAETHLTEENMLSDLLAAGFDGAQVYSAIDWLKGLIDLKDSFTFSQKHKSSGSLRVYNELEQQTLNSACRGLISHLEQIDVLNPMTRELVIDRLIALKSEGVDRSLVKWVSLMVLFNQGDEQAALEFMEYISLHQNGDGLQ